MTPTEFVKYVKKQARQHGIKVCLSKGKRVKLPAGELVNGYFDTNVLAVATGKPEHEWFQILAHEHSHMEQYLEHTEYFKPRYDVHYRRLERHLDGKRVPGIEHAISKIAELECDCEHRTLAKIIKYNLPVDPIRYAQKANAYILFHGWLLQKHQWYVTAPYEIDSIIDSMPTELIPVDKCNVEYFRTAFDLSIFDACKVKRKTTTTS